MKRLSMFYTYSGKGGGAGGVISFTAHLITSLRNAGVDARLYRIRPERIKSENFKRPFVKYDGVEYQNVSSRRALWLAQEFPSVCIGPYAEEKFLLPLAPTLVRLMRLGMRNIVHDSYELKFYKEHMPVIRKAICIRPAMQQHFKDSIHIPHPFVRRYDNEPAPKGPPLSISRVTFVKRSEIILQANKLLPKRLQVRLRGMANRMYVHHVLRHKYPEIKSHDMGFPGGWGEAAKVCREGRFAVDMSYFPEDGGGSQYTFMEAWDAGSVNVIASDWLRYKGEMKHGMNCLACAPSAQALSDLIRQYSTVNTGSIVAAGRKILKTRHDPQTVAEQYIHELEV